MFILRIYIASPQETDNALRQCQSQCSYSVIDSLRDRKPVQGIPHVGRHRTLFRYMLNETRQNSIRAGQNPIKAGQSTESKP